MRLSPSKRWARVALMTCGAFVVLIIGVSVVTFLMTFPLCAFGAYLREPIGAFLHGIFPTVPEPYAEMVGYSIAVTVLTFAAHIVTGPFLSKVAVNGVSKEADRALGAS